MKRLLFIGAHPDDETFFAAGTFARYVSEGVSISVVCATRGGAGKTAGLCSQEELPLRREQELLDAMGILGVSDVTFLSYIDRDLSEASVEQLRQELMSAIRRTKPQVVITFDPHGANQHPDHVAIARFAMDAISAAADNRWFPEAGPAHVVQRVLWTPPIFLFRLPAQREMQNEPGFDFLIDTTAFTDQKTRAFMAHASQFPHLRKLFLDDPNGLRTFGTEVFRLGFGMRPTRLPAHDLFVELLE